MRRDWTKAEDAALRRLYPDTPLATLLQRFDCSKCCLQRRARTLGVKRSTEHLRRVGKLRWSPEDDARLRELYPDTPTHQLPAMLKRPISSIYGRAQLLGIGKSEAYFASPASGRTRPGHNRGGATRFKTGQTPHNKGLRRPGYSIGRGRMQDTQFKKGCRAGIAVKLYQPIGSERISKDGYLERKTHDALPEGISREEANRLRQRRWRAVHLIVWEEANGPLPKGHAIAFKNGDKRDIRLDNLELISRRELMARNTVQNLPKPLKQTIQLLGALNRKIRRREREEQNR